jgi:hypothetical protein
LSFQVRAIFLFVIFFLIGPKVFSVRMRVQATPWGDARLGFLAAPASEPLDVPKASRQAMFFPEPVALQGLSPDSEYITLKLMDLGPLEGCFTGADVLVNPPLPYIDYGSYGWQFNPLAVGQPLQEAVGGGNESVLQ